VTASMAPRPAHVPAELVVDFDYFAPPGHETDVHLAWKRLHDPGVPDIFWTPRHGGHWVATRAADIDVMQIDHERFSYRHITIHEGAPAIPLIPLELDPPDHGPFRSLLTPAFGPARVQALTDQAVALTNQLIDEFIGAGECEFVEQFGKRLPIDMFLRLVDLPLTDRAELLAITEMSVRPKSQEERNEANRLLDAYVQKWIVERRARPGADLFSRMVNATVEGRPYTESETLGMLHNVLFGGLDTVASALGFIARFLADNPDHRRQLRENPALVPNAIEEFLRRFGVPQTARVITRDMEYNGIAFRKDELVQLPKVLHGLDERRYPDPLRVDFERKPRDHAGFGAGPHRCIGAGLARMEIRVFLEHWLRRIPEFRIKPGAQPLGCSGAVNGMMYLPLCWERTA
jgi:cytochrome P450